MRFSLESLESLEHSTNVWPWSDYNAANPFEKITDFLSICCVTLNSISMIKIALSFTNVKSDLLQQLFSIGTSKSREKNILLSSFLNGISRMKNTYITRWKSLNVSWSAADDEGWASENSYWNGRADISREPDQRQARAVQTPPQRDFVAKGYPQEYLQSSVHHL